jgi:hypothetical protein
MSPEQANGAVDARSDLFPGTILYRPARAVPFKGQDTLSVLSAGDANANTAAPARPILPRAFSGGDALLAGDSPPACQSAREVEAIRGD